MPECPMSPPGWRCPRPIAHPGPCALSPRWWNWGSGARRYRIGDAHAIMAFLRRRR